MQGDAEPPTAKRGQVFIQNPNANPAFHPIKLGSKSFVSSSSIGTFYFKEIFITLDLI